MEANFCHLGNISKKQFPERAEAYKTLKMNMFYRWQNLTLAPKAQEKED